VSLAAVGERGNPAESGTKHVCGFDRRAFGLGLSTACFYSSP